MAALLISPRRFELWRYAVSHGQLLLRANPDDTSPERVEVLFKDVVWLVLPVWLDGLTLSETGPALLAEFGAGAAAAVRLRSDRRVYLLEGTGYRGAVVAGAAYVHADREAYHAPSHFADGVLDGSP